MRDPHDQDIIEYCKRALNERPRNVKIEDVAIKTSLNRHWLNSFGQGRIKEPGFSKICTLYLWATSESLINTTRI